MAGSSDRTDVDVSSPSSSTDKPRGKDDTKMQALVSKLIKKGLDDYSAFQEILSRVSDVKARELIFDMYTKRLALIKKRVKKFKEKLVSKSSYYSMTPEERVKRAREYARASNLNDDEVSTFMSMMFTSEHEQRNYIDTPVTPMSRLLGNANPKMKLTGLEVNPTELSHVNDILALNSATNVLHSQIVLQSLTYEDCDLRAIYGGSAAHTNYKANIYSHVPPIVAALFLPRIKFLDECMLIGNIGSVIKSKQERQPIRTQPDYELYQNLMNDPSGHLCNEHSAIQDIKHRYIIQTKLWDNVLGLRQGLIFSEKYNELSVALSMCTSNIYDAPDIMQSNDEGTFMRRLLGTFGIRPTVVSTVSAVGSVMDPTGLPYTSAYGSNVEKLMSIPMITIRLPLHQSQDTPTVNILSAMNQTQWFKEGTAIVPKRQSVIFTREVIFFHINRRFRALNIASMQDPCAFLRLPSQVSGWDNINNAYVDFPCELNLLEDIYDLRSVVMIESDYAKVSKIIGSSAAILIPSNYGNKWLNPYEKSVLYYNPLASGITNWDPSRGDDKGVFNTPITYLDYDSTSDNNNVSFVRKASTNGSIFCYQKRPVQDKNCN